MHTRAHAARPNTAQRCVQLSGDEPTNHPRTTSPRIASTRPLRQPRSARPHPMAPARWSLRLSSGRRSRPVRSRCANLRRELPGTWDRSWPTTGSRTSPPFHASRTGSKGCHLVVAAQSASSSGARVTRIVRRCARPFSRDAQILPGKILSPAPKHPAGQPHSQRCAYHVIWTATGRPPGRIR